MSTFIAALPMYDWPEVRAEVDGEWARLRDVLRRRGIDAPEALTRENTPAHGLDLAALWRDPALLFAQTCWGPMGLGLAGHVQVIGQPDYSGYEGGQGVLYSSAIVMRREGGCDDLRPTAPPSVLPDISSTGGEICNSTFVAVSPALEIGESSADGLISPPVGEMSGRTEGGAIERKPSSRFATLPLDRLRGRRLAYNSRDSMSGIIALTRDLAAMGESLGIFSQELESGGHRASIVAVAEGMADVAAIDCRSWVMARRFEPAAKELAVVGWTARRRGLPYITARATPLAVVTALREALSELGMIAAPATEAQLDRRSSGG
jgi:ABC-type phosphate/phosphonate transport system substrate-binding protein